VRSVARGAIGPLLESFSCGRDHQLAVFYATQAQYSIRQVANCAAAASHDDDFQAVVMVQVNMRGGEHLATGVVLRFY
jgi:hypothetical protein